MTDATKTAAADDNIIPLLIDMPPGLNTATPNTDIEPSEITDGVGFTMASDGRLGKGTIPAGTTRVVNTVTISAVPYLWHYNRLWRATTTYLNYYAPYHQSKVLTQGASFLAFDEDAQSIVAFLPFGADSMFVAKSTGSYVVSNCADNRALFARSGIIQEMKCANINRIVELDGVIYVSNASGLMAYSGGQVAEITRKVRNNLTNFINLNLTADYEKKRIIAKDNADATKGFVYEIETKKILRFSGSSFNCRSRKVRVGDYSAFLAHAVWFTIEHDQTNTGYLKYRIRHEDQSTWLPVRTLDLPFADGFTSTIKEFMEPTQTARKFQMEITDISAGKFIKKIDLEIEPRGKEGYSL